MLVKRHERELSCLSQIALCGVVDRPTSDPGRALEGATVDPGLVATFEPAIFAAIEVAGWGTGEIVVKLEAVCGSCDVDAEGDVSIKSGLVGSFGFGFAASFARRRCRISNSAAASAFVMSRLIKTLVFMC